MLPNFGGNGFPMYFWCCAGLVLLIGSLVIWHGHLTYVFVANALYMAFIYMYIILACSYVVLIYPYFSCMCLCVMCAFHLLSLTQSHMGDSSTCIMVCCHYDNHTSAPIGNPSMVRLPWGLKKHPIFGMHAILDPIHHMILSLLWCSF